MKLNQRARTLNGAAPPSATIVADLMSDSYLDACRRLQEDDGARIDHEPILLGADYLERWEAEHQSRRNTCVAFAAAACMDILLNRDTSGPPAPLSPQFLYWSMRMDYPLSGDDVPPGYADGATRLSQADKVLRHKGICREDLAPYDLALLDFDEEPPLEGREPSAEAKADALTRRMTASTYEIIRDVPRPTLALIETYVKVLGEGRPIAVGVPTFDATEGRDNFWTYRAEKRGVVRGPLDQSERLSIGDETRSGHAFCIVGFEPDPEEPMGGWFLFRNSWGPDWGRYPDTDFGVPAQGYGAVSASYLAFHSWEYFSPIVDT